MSFVIDGTFPAVLEDDLMAEVIGSVEGWMEEERCNMSGAVRSSVRASAGFELPGKGKRRAVRAETDGGVVLWMWMWMDGFRSKEGRGANKTNESSQRARYVSVRKRSSRSPKGSSVSTSGASDEIWMDGWIGWMDE